MADGFFFEELSEYKQDILEKIAVKYPKETEKFLKEQGKNLSKVQKRIAKQDVGTSKKYGSKSYHKSFKVGKIFDYEGEKSIRAYNSSRHEHLVEKGHKTENGKFVQGRYVMKSSQNEFKSDFYKAADEFITDFIKELGK